MSSRPNRAAEPQANEARRVFRLTRGNVTRWHLLISLGVAAFCYSPTLLNFENFVYDDVTIIAENPRLRSLANLPEIWTSHWWETKHDADSPLARRTDLLYRPLTMTTFTVQHALHGLQPLGFILGNVCLHLVTVALVYGFARRLLSDPSVAFGAALIFALHPIHVEAVANGVGRAEVQMTVFLVGGLLCLLPRAGPPSVARGVAALVCFTAAMFTKESAISYGLAALLVLWWRRPRPGWPGRWWLSHVALLAAPVLLYLPARYVALGGSLLRHYPPPAYMNPLLHADNALEMTLGVFTVLGHYTRLMLVPAELSMNYGLGIIELSGTPTPMAWLGMATAVAALIGLAGLLRKSHPWRAVGLLTALTIASYLLISNIFVRIGVTLAERFFYWPSVPVCILMAMGALALWRQLRWSPKTAASTLRLVSLAGIALLVALGLRSGVRVLDWHSNARLISADAQTYPRDVHISRLYVAELLKALKKQPEDAQRGRMFAEASTYAKRALELDPQNSHLLAQMGRLLLLAGNAREAKVYLTRAEQLGHLAPEIRQALAEVRQRLGETRSINELEAAIAASPNEPELYAALARRQLANNQLDEAQALLDQALARWPENVALVDALGRLQLIREDPQAHATLKRLVALAPSHWEAYHNLAVITVTRDPEQALHYARRAVALAPQKFETNYNLALVLIHNRQWQEALNLLRAIHAQLDAGDPLRAAAAERIEFVEKQIAGE